MPVITKKISAIAILHTSGHQQLFIDFLCDNGYYTQWQNADKTIFTLPVNCVWRQCEVPASSEVKEALSLLLEEIPQLLAKFNESNPAIVIEQLLVVPSTPWAALSDEEKDPWWNSDRLSKFKEFSAAIRAINPKAEEKELKVIFKTTILPSDRA